MIFFFHLRINSQEKVSGSYPLTIPIPKWGSIFENFVINNLQNEKQYL